MTYRKTMLSASIVAALMFTGAAFAHDSNTNAPQPQATQSQNDQAQNNQTNDNKEKSKELAGITVVGIRNAAALSLQLKQEAVSDVDVVTAEDIGKLPAKNVADSLQMIPGVTTATSSAGEGGFDENDRVSLRGTPPSMTLTTVDGHGVGTGDWFVLNQTSTVGRSVSYDMLPSQIVSEVVVHKSSEAKLLEGGATGTVNIITRKPLQFKKTFTTHLNIGGVYSSLPDKTQPQASALFNYKNDADTFGFMVQGFYQKRSLERYGQEILGLETLNAGDPVVTAHPDLEGKYVPTMIGNALFKQKRTREGGALDIQFRPTDSLSINLNGFYSKLKANNFNTNYLLWGTSFVHGNVNLADYNVVNGMVTDANFDPTNDNTIYGIYDQISRGASSDTRYETADIDWQPTESLSWHLQLGNTEGHGKSPYQDVMEMATATGLGGGWAFHGTGTPASWHLNTPSDSSPADSGATMVGGWIFGEGDIDVIDKENWVGLDGELDFFNGPVESLQFGARYSDHTRANDKAYAQGPKGDWQNPANFPQTIEHYPGNFASKLGAHGIPANVWHYTPGELAAYDAKYANRTVDGTLASRLYPNDIYSVKEKDSAAYIQANFQGNNWSGNFGLRYVTTKENIGYSSGSILETDYQGPYMNSAFFPDGWYFNHYKHRYSKLLPSGNLKFNLTDKLQARVSASQTITRPDYSAMAGSKSLDDTGHTGTGGNPKLKPLISTNFDASLQWFFAPRGLLGIDVYEQSLHNYVDYGFKEESFKDMQASDAAGHDVYADYKVSEPISMDGNVRGVELDYQQPLGKYFGMMVNYTYAAGHTANGGDLQGTSKNSANASVYFENDWLNARVDYSYRSKYYAGPDRGGKFYLLGQGYLSASVGIKLTDWASLNLVGRNLNSPELKYTVQDLPGTGTQPYRFYVNGRQYYVTLRMSF